MFMTYHNEFNVVMTNNNFSTVLVSGSFQYNLNITFLLLYKDLEVFQTQFDTKFW